MKAMVVCIKGKRAAVLAHDGTFNEIKNRNYKIGQILDYKQPDLNIINFTTKYSSKIAAAAAAVLIVSGTLSANTFACSTVTLDVNPSLRYGLNIFDRVVDIDSYNNDGEEIADLIRKEIMGKKIDTALDITFDALEDADYIEEDTPVVVTVASHMGKEEKLKNSALDEMDSWNRKKHRDGENGEEKSISANIVVITGDELYASEKKNESPGRELLDKIKAPGDKREEALDIPQIQEYELENEEKTPPDPDSESKEPDKGNAPPKDIPQGEQKSTEPADPGPQDMAPPMPDDQNAGNPQQQEAPYSPPEERNTYDPQPSDPQPSDPPPSDPQPQDLQPPGPQPSEPQPQDPQSPDMMPPPEGQNGGGQPPEQGVPPAR